MKTRGFTLVELAIVLVIIGLLMGGILKGQELINSAKVKSLAGDFRAVSSAYFGYLDRFRAVPGDDAAPNVHVNGGLPAATGTHNNGIIEGAWDSDTVSDAGRTESVMFWQHVRLAGLLTGATDQSNSTYLPYNSEGGRIGISAGSKPISDSNYRGSFWVCSGNVSARLVRQLDAMLDDGATNTGNMRATGTTGGAASTLSVSDEGNGSVYIVCMAY